MKITKRQLKRIIREEYTRVLSEARPKVYKPDLMSARHDNGRPNNLSIALDIAWNDILESPSMFGSPRFSYPTMANKPTPFKLGYYTFFRAVAEENRVPSMGQFGQNPDWDHVAKNVMEYAMPSPRDFDPEDREHRSLAARGFAKAHNLVDQMRKTFYRAGPRPETWSS